MDEGDGLVGQPHRRSGERSCPLVGFARLWSGLASRKPAHRPHNRACGLRKTRGGARTGDDPGAKRLAIDEERRVWELRLEGDLLLANTAFHRELATVSAEAGSRADLLAPCGGALRGRVTPPWRATIAARRRPLRRRARRVPRSRPAPRRACRTRTHRPTI